jgi:beta-N-acetylhexosaminidase
MQQIMFSFRGYQAPPEILDAVRAGVAGAFCLFAYNVESPEQLRALCQSLMDAAAEGGFPPPLIGIDQEGGQLMSINGQATALPGNMALGAARSVELARAAGGVLGRELRAVGVNLNFAPSLDVNNNPLNPVIGVRSFGDDPEWVGRLGTALIAGMEAEGVLATAKHFPGHGDIVSDTHHGQALVPHALDRMNAVELAPFRAAIAHGVGAIMSAHITFTALDDQPATLSRRILHGLLRDEMGYDGLIITDAMDMYAVSRLGAYESVSAALRAGADLVMLGHLPDQLALAQRMVPFGTPEAAARVMRARERLPRTLLPFELLGCAAHQQVAHQIAEAAVTRVRGEATLQMSARQRLTVIVPKPVNLTPADTSAMIRVDLAAAFARRGILVDAIEIPFGADLADIRSVVGRALKSDHIVIGTIAADQDPAQAALVNGLLAEGRQPVVVALRTPYDLGQFPTLRDYWCTYSIRPAAVEAFARAVLGEFTPTGVLPCRLPSDPLPA